jgi:hypothetical protein
MKRMQPAVLWGRALATALALTMLSAGAARAGLEVKDVQEDKIFNIPECEFPYCPVTLAFKILNNGKDDATYDLIKYGGFKVGVTGDFRNDVVAESDEFYTPDCSHPITVSSNCVVTLDLLVEDKNPSDDEQLDASAKTPDSRFLWGVQVQQYSRDGKIIDGGPFNDHWVGVLDDTPEPSTWLLLGLGFGATGGVLRRRRRRPPSNAPVRS